MTDSLGYSERPERYATPSGREVIDIMRDCMDDASFVACCGGIAIAYRLRVSSEPRHADDASKAAFYDQMARHVQAPVTNPDPRYKRPGFTPYERQRPPPEVVEHYRVLIGQYSVNTYYPVPR